MASMGTRGGDGDKVTVMGRKRGHGYGDGDMVVAMGRDVEKIVGMGWGRDKIFYRVIL